MKEGIFDFVRGKKTIEDLTEKNDAVIDGGSIETDSKDLDRVEDNNVKLKPDNKSGDYNWLENDPEKLILGIKESFPELKDQIEVLNTELEYLEDEKSKTSELYKSQLDDIMNSAKWKISALASSIGLAGFSATFLDSSSTINALLDFAVVQGRTDTMSSFGLLMGGIVAVSSAIGLYNSKSEINSVNESELLSKDRHDKKEELLNNTLEELQR